MSKTFEQGRDEIAALCDYFARNRAAFLAPGIKEAHVRQTLIDPFFEALGWDVRNAAMAAPQYREVIPEDSIDVEGEQKAPDYTFRVGTLPKFFVEAKKCGVNINADPAPAEYQQRQLPCLPRRCCVGGPLDRSQRRGTMPPPEVRDGIETKRDITTVPGTGRKQE